jgi:hypothetical protein
MLVHPSCLSRDSLQPVNPEVASFSVSLRRNKAVREYSGTEVERIAEENWH